MKIGILGGAGAMGGAIGGVWFENGHEIHLLDVNADAVERINSDGLTIERKDSAPFVLKVPASCDPNDVGRCDLVVVFVKCYHTEAAIKFAAPLIQDDTLVLSLQNGWGNGQKIASAIGSERLRVGVTYHSATLTGPAKVFHAGIGPTHVGKLDGSIDGRTEALADALSSELFPIWASSNAVAEIWKKLCLNICTLPTSGLLGLRNCQLIEHEGSLALMRSMLEEGVAVANAHNIPIDFDERWAFITSLLARVGMSKSSMLQDVEAKRRTEIEVINGAIVAAGAEAGVRTPFNQAAVWMVQALQETFA